MENKKYYTPTIEEFHVGFEFEALNSPLWFFTEANYGWKKITLSENLTWSTFHFANISSSLQRNWIRVKYLDREDIESLGYKKARSIYNSFTSSFRLNDYWFLHLNNLEPHNVWINNMESYEDERTKFDGTIKNKSELKKTLKQLGI
jgi:hypothetical protein